MTVGAVDEGETLFSIPKLDQLLTHVLPSLAPHLRLSPYDRMQFSLFAKIISTTSTVLLPT
jgi:hypothetical protein